jgi:uncharacterized protein YjbI with pentapeptide repeats
MKTEKPDTGPAILGELCKLAQGAWFALLGFLAFCAVVMLSTSDADFLINTRQTTIPLLNVIVPTERFFFLAPIVATALYCYLHYFCLKLWAEAREADPRILRGCNTLIGDVPRYLREGVPARGGDRWSLLSTIVSALLLWAAAPALFVIALLRSDAADTANWISPQAHPFLALLLPSTVAGVTVLAISVMGAVGVASLTSAIAISRPAPRGAPLAVLALAALLAPLATLGDWARSGAAGVRIERQTVSQIPQGWMRAEESREAFRLAWCRDAKLAPRICAVKPRNAAESLRLAYARRDWCRTAWNSRNRVLCENRFLLSDAEFAAAWRAARMAQIDRVPEVDLEGRDLARIAASGASLIHARMPEADLRDGVLVGADFEGANLLRARLDNATAYYARFDRANLTEATLDGANLTSTSLEDVALPRASLRAALLIEAVLAGADLAKADLTAADLTGAVLDRAQIADASFEGAILDGADLSRVTGYDRGQFDLAIGDAKTRLPGGLAPRPCWVKVPPAAEEALNALPPGLRREAAWRGVTARRCSAGDQSPPPEPGAAPVTPEPDLAAYEIFYAAERCADRGGDCLGPRPRGPMFTSALP